MGNSAKDKFSNTIEKSGQYSFIFYSIVLAFLLLIRLDVFKEGIVNDHLTDIVTGIVLIPIGSFLIGKLRNRNKKPDPHLICPNCEGKMKPSGKWKCDDCDGEFNKPKKID